jgi:Tfp pilus assembly protein PilF
MLLIFGGLALAGVGCYFAYRYLRAEYYFRAAEKARQERNFSQAHLYLDECLKVWPRSVRVHFLGARIARQAGFYEEAERHLDLCQQLQQQTPEFQLERSLLQVHQGAFSALTETQLRNYVNDQHPASEEILEALSQGCMRTFRLNNAQTYLDLWLQRRPDNVQAWLWLGWVHERMLNAASAKEDYQKAVQLAPENGEAQFHLAQMLLTVGDLQQAEAAFERLRQSQPDNPLVAMGLAQSLSRLGQTAEARRLLDELVTKFPKEAPVLVERGRLALQTGHADEAEPWLRRAAKLAPRDYQANYTLYLCLKQLGKEAEARERQERVRVIEADVQRLQELTFEVQQHAYDLSRRCEIGQIFLRNGESQQGLDWLKNVLKIDPQHAEANRALAEYYEQHGDPALAARYRQPGQQGKP